MRCGKLIEGLVAVGRLELRIRVRSCKVDRALREIENLRNLRRVDGARDLTQLALWRFAPPPQCRIGEHRVELCRSRDDLCRKSQDVSDIESQLNRCQHHGDLAGA